LWAQLEVGFVIRQLSIVIGVSESLLLMTAKIHSTDAIAANIIISLARMPLHMPAKLSRRDNPMKKLLVAIGFLFMAITAGASDPEILTQFFGPNGIKDKSAAYYGEMLKYYVDKPTLGEGLPKGTQSKFRKLSETKNSAIYAVLLSNGGKTQDWYAFLVKDNEIWKLRAVRTLALSGVFSLALQELEKKSSRSKEEEWEYQNMLLTARSDNELKSYLKDNIGKFNEAVALLAKGEKELAKKTARSIYINLVKNDAGIIDFSIGGILDNSVGYLFVPSNKRPPDMDPSKFIYIEQVISGWYLYKTT
jgi:hypothetical protein